jgi:hypothetical protein
VQPLPSLNDGYKSILYLMLQALALLSGQKILERKKCKLRSSYTPFELPSLYLIQSQYRFRKKRKRKEKRMNIIISEFELPLSNLATVMVRSWKERIWIQYGHGTIKEGGYRFLLELEQRNWQKTVSPPEFSPKEIVITVRYSQKNLHLNFQPRSVQECPLF